MLKGPSAGVSHIILYLVVRRPPQLTFAPLMIWCDTECKFFPGMILQCIQNFATSILTSAFRYVSLTISSTWLDKLTTWHCLFIHHDFELNRNGTSWHQSSFHSTIKQYCIPPLFLLPLLCAIYCKTKAIITLHNFLSSVAHTLPSCSCFATHSLKCKLLFTFPPAFLAISVSCES